MPRLSQVTSSAEEFYDNGMALYSEGHVDQAVIHFRNAVDSWTPNEGIKFSTLQYWWLRCLFLQGRFAEAELNFKSIRQDDFSLSFAIDFLWLRADIKFALSKFQEAKRSYWEAFQLAIRYDVDYFIEFKDVEVFTDMWTCFFLTENAGYVEETLKFLYIDNVTTAHQLAEIALLHTSHEYSGQMTQIPLESCARCLELSFQLHPLPSTLGLLGRHLQVGGQAEAAISVYRQMASMFPDEFDENTARSFGWALQTEGLIEEAEVWLRRSALEYYPEDFYELEPLITFYGEFQRWNEAKEIVENYISGRLFSSRRKFGDSISWAWDIHAACCERLGDSERAAESRLEALKYQESDLRKQIANGEHPLALHHLSLGTCLKNQGRTKEAESSFNLAKQMLESALKEDERKWWALHWLGILNEMQGELELAEGYFREALLQDWPAKYGDSDSALLGRVLIKRGNLDEAESILIRDIYALSFDSHESRLLSFDLHKSIFWLGRCLFAQGRFTEAEQLFTEVLHEEPFNSDYLAALSECRQASAQRTKDNENDDYPLFIENGRHWLEPAGWIPNRKTWFERVPRTRILARLFNSGAKWAEPNIPLFNDFDISEEDLDDTLARAVAISSRIHLLPEVPIKLETRNLSIEFDLEGQLLRAWVGRSGVGIPISVDVTTWELIYIQGHRDSMFAVGAAINWFIDCSISLESHSNFQRLEQFRSHHEGATEAAGNSWTTRPQFHTDIEQMRSGYLPLPPRAHRVRGHVRRLGDGTPSDSARDNAPPYIRRHMAPGDTWVRGHSRGGDVAGDQLINRLHSSSSLADFLGTATRS